MKVRKIRVKIRVPIGKQIFLVLDTKILKQFKPYLKRGQTLVFQTTKTQRLFYLLLEKAMKKLHVFF